MGRKIGGGLTKPPRKKQPRSVAYGPKHIAPPRHQASGVRGPTAAHRPPRHARMGAVSAKTTTICPLRSGWKQRFRFDLVIPRTGLVWVESAVSLRPTHPLYLVGWAFGSIPGWFGARGGFAFPSLVLVAVAPVLAWRLVGCWVRSRVGLVLRVFASQGGFAFLSRPYIWLVGRLVPSRVGLALRSSRWFRVFSLVLCPRVLWGRCWVCYYPTPTLD